MIFLVKQKETEKRVVNLNQSLLSKLSTLTPNLGPLGKEKWKESWRLAEQGFLASALSSCSLLMFSLPSESLVLPQFPSCSHPSGLPTGLCIYGDSPELS